MVKAGATVRARDELELREKLAARTTAEANDQARRLCAVSSRFCRAGEPEEWFDLEVVGECTFCFCAAHALAAELGAVACGLPARYLIGRLLELERQHDKERTE